jgi:hypothetical protein
LAGLVVVVGVAASVLVAVTLSPGGLVSDLFPRDGIRFLEDARERSVLRTVGSVYQFRHARLQDQLAGVHTPH